jgi:H+/Cl- antiporter ClcA
MAEEASAEPDPIAIMRDRSFVRLLVLAGIVGFVTAVAAWCFLEVIHAAETGVYTDLPKQLGFDSTPRWWGLPLLVIAGFIVAFAIKRLPGNGGHVPVFGLNATPTPTVDLPGVLLAALAAIGLGIVLGPEAPLIALGGGLGFLGVKLLAGDSPPEVGTIIAMAGVFSALSFLFGSPVIAAVLLIEAAGLEKSKLTLVLIPGLLAAGIGSLVSSGLGSWTGLDSSDISLTPVQLANFPRPDIVDFLWTIPLAIAIALGVYAIFWIGHRVQPFAARRPFAVLPIVGAATAVIAMVFAEITGHGIDEVLFSGEVQLPGLVADAGSWSLGALALLCLLKGIAYGLALGSFRGGPVFPALFLGTAAGLMAAKLPGFELAPAVAVGMGAAVVAVLRLPLSSLVLAVLLTASASLGPSALVIVGVVVSYLVTIALPAQPGPEDAPTAPAQEPAPAPA